MLILESQLRSIIKQELKIILESNIKQMKQEIQSYVKELSKTNPNINQQSIKELEDAIRDVGFNANPSSYYADLVYNKPKEQITYQDYLDKMTSVLGLSTPLTLDGVSFSYDLNKPMPQYPKFDDSQETYLIILLQYLKQNPSINVSKAISDLKRNGDQIMTDIQKTQKEKEANKKKDYLEKWGKLAAPDDAPLQKYAFSPQRQGSENPPPKEPNKPLEVTLLRAIKRHFEGSKLLSLEYAESLKDMMSKGLYPDVFKAPTVDMIYRGMTVSEDFIKSYLDVDPQSIGDEAIEINKAIAVKQTKNAYSWTTDFEVAKEFSTRNEKGIDNPYSIVLEASVARNKGILLDADSLYDVKELDEFEAEAEVISLGDVVTSKILIERLTKNG
jgi:hypothetical protein